MDMHDKGLVMIWIHEIVDNPEGYKMYYSDNDQQTLAKCALQMLGEIDCVDYVVTHTEYPIQQDSLYRTLCVGKYHEDGELSDNVGNSISQYNSSINECTGLYWIWKNTSSEYVGLSHYRRFFFRDFDDDLNRIDKQRIKEILIDKEYDIILSLKLNLNWSIYRNMQQMVGDKFCDIGYKAFHDAIEKHQPEYLEVYEEMFKHNRMYSCNMFVTRRDILNAYCEWLFSFLLEAADNIDVSDGVDGQTRTAGYFAELMWTVWLAKQDLKIYELPIMRV